MQPASLSDAPDLGPLAVNGGHAVAQRGLRFAWQIVIPALLAGVVMRYFVPRGGHGVAGAVASLGREHGLYLYAGLFLGLSALVQYWHLRIPLGRLASRLPVQIAVPAAGEGSVAETVAQAALYERARLPRMRSRVERLLGPGELAELEIALGVLRSSLIGCDPGAARAASLRVEAIAGRVPSREWVRTVLALCLAVAGAAGAMALLRARIAEPYEVLSTSMLPTLKPDELLVGNHLAWPHDKMPRRGDIIAFRSAAVALGPGALTVPDVLLKRVIGLPGDRIEMRGGLVKINGWEVPSCDVGEYAYLLNDTASTETLRGMRGELRLEFLGDQTYFTLFASSALFAGYVVQPGEVFVLGDNRGNSLDSRAYNGGRGGGVPREAIEARADWFLSRRARNGATDLSRLFGRVSAFDKDLEHEEALDWDAARAGIQRCLQNRPQGTSPPSPPAPTVAVGGA